MINLPKNKNVIRYNLAKAYSRIFASLCDFIIIIGINLGLSFLIFNTSIIDGWQVFVFSIILFISFFIYFIIIPFFWNGYTTFKYIFKIKTVSILLKNISQRKWLKNLDFIFIIQLIRKEALIWIVPLFIFFIFGIICISMGANANNFILSIIKIKNSSNLDYDNSYFIYSTIFIALFSICFLVDFVLFISVILNSGRKSLHDFISDTVVVKIGDIKTEEPSNNLNYSKTKNIKKIKYNLPGDISPKLLDEEN